MAHDETYSDSRSASWLLRLLRRPHVPAQPVHLCDGSSRTRAGYFGMSEVAFSQSVEVRDTPPS
jgi:hypothetical protein